jgi:glycosyltransferase involved in cell wall biosynthesis
MQLNIIANWMQGSALSGGDRIFIELGRRWVSRLNIKLFISSDGWEICQRERFEDINHEIWAQDRFNKYGYFINYLYRTSISIIKSLQLKIDKDNTIYSSSDFWPDSFPAFIMKLKNKNVKWIAGFYLFAAPPWRKDSPYKKRFVTGLFYWLTQLPIYWIVKRYADMVFVTSEPDVKRFITEKRNRDKIIVIRGGVDIKPSEKYLNSESVIPVEKRKYDACFIGRFHPQKGVLELVDIWKIVCQKRPEAKLVVIGTGPLENELKDKMERLGLKGHIELLGFKDGYEKYYIFKQSKIVVHPATYDSGGMAACEAMAWGLPGVSFDLEALKTYYPKGMLKTPCYDLKAFAKNIIKLLKDKELYNKNREDAIAWAREWDWDKRAEIILNKIQELYD